MDQPEPPELPRGIALAWGVAATPQRGPKREMSVERIVDAAVELADVDGLGAVSMAAVAAKLGFTPMSLYRYVTAKDDLLLLMQEQATGMPPEAYRQEEGWRAKLTLLFDAQVQVYLRHPWLVALPITGAPITPNSSAWVDTGLDCLDGTPLTDVERLATALAVTGEARWQGIVLSGYHQQARSLGIDPDEVAQREAALFDRVIGADEFPALRRVIDSGVFTAPDDPFRFALERILDGVDAYIARLDRGEPRDAATFDEEADEDEATLERDKRVREARKAVQEAEKRLREARTRERQAVREARERASRPSRSR